jgi:ABC-type Fe3+/spermidine/putrescine transport system ATPase subunit
MEAADEIFVLHDGLIVQRGSPISIYQSPKSPDVAKLFGLINILNRQQSLSLFNLDKAIGIWAEDLKIVKNGSIKGKVERVVFAGGFHKLNVKVNAKLDLVVIDHTKNITEGQQIKLEVATENIITFQN